MEKLISLLNEYKMDSNFIFKGFNLHLRTFDFYCVPTKPPIRFPEEQILGKRYGFVEWLINNNKIGEVEYGLGCTNYSKSDNLIRLLAIKNKPSEFLVSILK